MLSSGRSAARVAALGDVLAPVRVRNASAAALVVSHGDGTATVASHEELDAAVSRKVATLLAAGVGPGDRVGIVSSRGASLVSAVLAVLRCGAAYVPVDPAAPPRRWSVIVQGAAIGTILAPAGDADRVAATGARWLDRDLEAADGPTGSPIAPAPDDDAYVLFTSGSTGVPKGVRVSHRNVTARLESYLALTDDPCRYLLHSPLTFDGAVGGMFSTLLRGGCLVLPTDEEANDPARCADLIARWGVTHLEPVPSWYEALLDVSAPGQLDSVRNVILGGEVLEPRLVERHRAAVPQARLFNDYGPTEATVAATVFEVLPGWTGTKVPIGRPHLNTDIRLVGDDGREVADGDVGEIWIGGPGVATGYLDGDREAFVTDDDGSRWYRTGDLASLDPDGQVDYVGRRDRQVKLRGQRIELGEIEATLGRMPGVRHVAVRVVRGGGGDRLVAYVQPDPGTPLDEDRLRAHVGSELPAHLRPSGYVVVEAMPLTSTGKIDRSNLPEPPPHKGSGRRGSDPVADSVAVLFGEVLEVADVGVDDDFFALGGQSLAAARLLARVRSQLQREVTVADLRRAPTPSELVALVADRPDVAPVEALTDVVDATRTEGPASPRQQSFWYLESLPGGAGGSNLVSVLPVPLGADLGDVRRALTALTERHPALRTSLQLVDGALRQRVHDAVDVAVEPLGHVDDVESAATAFGAVPFDLSCAPLLRGAVATDDAGDWLIAVVHHTVADGWSLAVMDSELLSLLRGYVDLGPAPVATPLDVATWIDRRSRTDAASFDHWRARVRDLDDVSYLVPYDHAVPAMPTMTAGLVRRSLDAETRDAIRTVADDRGVTPFHVLLTALGAHIVAETGLRRFVVAGPVAVREDDAVAGTVGCLINTGLFLIDACGVDTADELLERVARSAESDVPHLWLPAEHYLRASGADRGGELAPVMLNLLEMPASMPAGVTTLPAAAAYSDIDVYLEPHGDDVRVDVVYSSDRLEQATVEAWTERWLQVLARFCTDPGVPLHEIRHLDDDEREHLEALGTGADPGGELEAVPARAARLAAEDPSAPAIADAAGEMHDRSWLDGRARAIASGLRSRGVGRGDHVVLALDGNVDAVAALLGTWYLGAVAVPVGRRQPPSRLDEMVSQSSATIVVTEADLPDLAAAEPLGEIVEPALGDRAYVIFTSGSTGRPKGVAVSHRALATSTRARELAYERPDTALVAHDLSFDASIGIVAWYLADGGRLVMTEHEERLDPDRLGAAIQRWSVGQLDIVPSHYRLLLDTAPPEQLGSLRLVTLGGEECHPSLIATHVAHLPATRLVNEYGPTEATVWCAAHDCTVDDIDLDRVPIGRPIAGAVLRVRAADDRPAPIGIAGELLIGGDLLAEGYLEGTDSCAFVDWDGQRWYRTGDRCRWTPDGQLEFLGRIDGQISLRGYRLEPGEIESVLTEHDDVARAVVGTWQNAGPHEDSLVAWLQPSSAGEIDVGSVRRHAIERMPSWMVPDVLTVVDELPTGLSGKVDLPRLPAPDLGASTADDAPETPTEEAIHEIWRGLLGRPVGVDRDFFMAGGNSLSAARMVTQVRNATGRPLSLADVIREPRIRSIAKLIDEAATTGGDSATAPLATLSVEQAKAMLDRIDELTDDEVEAAIAVLEGS